MGFDRIRESAEVIMSGFVSAPVAFDNVDFKSMDQTDWVRITILDGDSFLAAIGTNCIRHTGIITIQVFISRNEGTSIARTYAQEIAGLFNNVVDDRVTYQVAALTRIGYQEGFYQLNVDIPFQYDEHEM